MELVCTILVNWNGRDDTLACLESLREESFPRNQIIVVDNGSADDSVAAITAAYPEVEVIATGSNLGFTGGSNVGINRALERGANYVFLLNNDTTVEAGAIDALVAAAEANPMAGLLTPVIYYFDHPEKPWFAGSQIDLRQGKALHANAAPPGRMDPPKVIPWASGCAMLIPAQLVKQLGGFDDRFFLNWEDVDLSLRIQSAGFEILLVPSARIYHRVGKSFAAATGPGEYYRVRNNLLFVRLHCGSSYWLSWLRIISRNIRTVTGRVVRGEPSSAYFICLAVLHALAGRYGRADLH